MKILSPLGAKRWLAARDGLAGRFLSQCVAEPCELTKKMKGKVGADGERGAALIEGKSPS